MAQARGITCDECKQFVVFEGKDLASQPDGWFRLLMPQVEHHGSNPIEYKDLCSGCCVERFGKARRQAEAPARAASSSDSRVRASTIDSGLLKFLDEHGILPRQRGALSQAHGRHDTIQRDCVYCQYDSMVGAVLTDDTAAA